MNDSNSKLTKNVYMSKSKSDKPLVIKMIAACIAAILIFHFAWFRQLAVNLHEWLFVTGDIILLIAFSYFSNASYKYADDPNKEYNRYIVVALAAALCLWAGAWAAYVNEKVL